MAIRKFFQRLRRDRDRAAEIAAHLAEAIDHYKSKGMSEAEATRIARLRFGNPRAYREKVDDMNRLPVLDVLGRDLSYAIRRLVKAPAFSLTVIATLALVVGAASAVFSMADGVLLKPLPLPQPDRLATVSYKRVSPTGEYIAPALDGAMFAAARDHATLIDVALGSWGTSGVNFVLDRTPSFVQSQSVGAGYFRVLGVQPAIGREFSVAEAQPGGPAVALLSHSFWRQIFQGNRDVLGRTILLRGEPFTIVGVMPEEFHGMAGDPDVWTPLQNVGQGLNYVAVARLRDGATIEAANAELASLGEKPFTMLLPLTEGASRSLVLQGLQVTLGAEARPFIEMLAWAVGTVLLIACANIASLLLARGGSRAKEIATRMALGSGRFAVVRQLMVESAVLALIGGVLGVAVAYAGVEGLKSLVGTAFADWDRVTLDGRTVAVSLGLSALTSLVFGLLPAWQTSRIDVQRTLADGGSRSIAGGSRHVARRALVVAEVALGVVLLVSAGLLIRQLAAFQSLDPGFSPHRLYSAGASIQDARYKDPAVVRQLFAASLDRLQRAPGIEAAAVSLRLPYERLLNMVFAIEGRPGQKPPPVTDLSYVSSNFFSTFDIAIREGRALGPRDTEAAPGAVVVNETFKKVYFPNEPVIGRRVLFGDVAFEIVGMSGNVQQGGTGFFRPGMGRGPILSSPTMYMPVEQTQGRLFSVASPVWTVRARSSAEATAALQSAVHDVDPLLPLGDVRSMSQVVSKAMARPRLIMTLVGVLAVSALLLAAIGINGLITHTVSERTREFGIRLALGAGPARTMTSVAMSGAAMAALGAAIGVALSFPATRVIEGFLYTVGKRDVWTYAGVGVLLFAVAAVSSVLPALRILKLDAAKTLRD